MESTPETATDQSVAGSASGPTAKGKGKAKSAGKMGKSVDDKSSPTTSGPDSDVGSVDDLPIDDENDEKKSESSKVSAGASYIGSFFSSAWSKTAKTANDATVGGTAFLSSAFQKVGGSGASTNTSAKTSPKEETAKPVETEDKETSGASSTSPSSTADGAASIVNSSSSFFSTAWNKVGEITKSVAGPVTAKSGDQPAETTTDQPEPDAAEDKTAESSERKSSGASFLTTFSTMVTKAASDATHVIKDKVGTSVATTMLSEFNREQEEFIKSKGAHEAGMAPWEGYKDAAGMKEKILALSDDKRTFVRAPPSGVTFEFDYNVMAPVALAILKEDPKLEKMRYELVPKVVKEDEFWRNYFYRLNLVKQSFDLKDLESSTGPASNSDSKAAAPNAKAKLPSVQDDDDQSHVNTTDADDEFVSEAYQASSKDLDEANENMKRLGVKNTDEEWEAELEGELNEFEVVSSKEGSPHNPDWENEIQDMLDAEENK